MEQEKEATELETIPQKSKIPTPPTLANIQTWPDGDRATPRTKTRTSAYRAGS